MERGGPDTTTLEYLFEDVAELYVDSFDELPLYCELVLGVQQGGHFEPSNTPVLIERLDSQVLICGGLLNV